MPDNAEQDPAEVSEAADVPSGLRAVESTASPVEPARDEATVDAGPEGSPAAGLITRLEDTLGMRVLVYYADVNGTMGRSDVAPTYRLLREMGHQDKLALVLQSPGGSADTAHLLANLLHDYVDQLHVHIPAFAASAGTLLALSADKLWMGPTSELSPIDPQIPIDANMLIPTSDGMQSPYSSGETVHIPAHVIKDFLELTGVIASGNSRPKVDTERLETLLRPLNPWILGWYERADKVSRIYAKEALANHLMKGEPEAQIDGIVDKLVDHYASHNAGILRAGARRLGIPFGECPDRVWTQLEALDAFYSEVFQAQGILRVIETTDGAHAAATYRERTCRRCEEATRTEDDFLFCPSCGEAYAPQCPGCEAPTQAQWRYCPRCGVELDPPAVSSQA